MSAYDICTDAGNLQAHTTLKIYRLCVVHQRLSKVRDTYNYQSNCSEWFYTVPQSAAKANACEINNKNCGEIQLQLTSSTVTTYKLRLQFRSISTSRNHRELRHKTCRLVLLSTNTQAQKWFPQKAYVLHVR